MNYEAWVFHENEESPIAEPVEAKGLKDLERQALSKDLKKEITRVDFYELTKVAEYYPREKKFKRILRGI